MEAFKKLGASTFTENVSVVQKSNIVFISCPPLAVAGVLHEIKHHGAGRLFISIAKDVTVANIERMICEHYMADARVIRVVTNPPTLVGCGVSVFMRGKNVTEEDLTLTRKLLCAVGTCDEVSENLLDSCIALTGTGQAAAFVMMEALADSGVKLGLPRDMAIRISYQTMFGTGALAKQTGKHPAILKDEVTSAGGSTATGLNVLEQNGNIETSFISYQRLIDYLLFQF
jgi:pyrroline-5-carboxylate reductase